MKLKSFVEIVPCDNEVSQELLIFSYDHYFIILSFIHISSMLAALYVINIHIREET